MPSATRTYDIGVVGAGKIASSAHLPVLVNTDRANVQYVADVDKTQVKALSRSYGIDAVVTDDPADLPECDVALLATPVGVREGYIEEFGHRNTPVLSEKPFAPGLATREAFIDAVGAISCNYLRLCFGSTCQLREIVQAGVFGPVERVAVSEGGVVGATGRSQDDYQTDPSLSGGGVLVERGSHMVSQLCSVLGTDEIIVENATMTTDEGYDVDVTADLEAQTDDGRVPVSFDLTRIRPVPNEFRVEFSNATLRFTIDTPGADLVVSRDGREVCTIEPDDRWATTFAQSAYLRWRQFFSKLGPDDEYPEEMATGPEVTRLIETLYDKAEVREL